MVSSSVSYAKLLWRKILTLIYKNMMLGPVWTVANEKNWAYWLLIVKLMEYRYRKGRYGK